MPSRTGQVSLAPKFQSSGDLAADRRFDYAHACMEEGHFAAAVDLYEQALERAPAFAPAWFELGRARLSAKAPDAAAAFEQALRLEPEDALGASLYLARIRAADGMSPPAMPAAYVTRLFDHYAPSFETHLTESLGYRAPEALFEALERLCRSRRRPMRFAHALDLGCGTGLAALRFAAVCDRIDGCDLSSAMLARAEAKGLYRRLSAVDALAFLEEADEPADLIVAADLFPYVGELAPVLGAAAGRLAPGGLIAFTLQHETEGKGVSIGSDLRYSHSRDALEAGAAIAGLSVRSCTEETVRRERGRDVPSLVVVLDHG